MQELRAFVQTRRFSACFDRCAGLHASSVVPRLIHDRFFAYDEIHGCDLVTGAAVRLDDLPGDPNGGAPDSLIEILNDGRDGCPRWVVADARNGAQAAAVAARTAAGARRHGFVPLLVPLYLRWRVALAADLEERTLLLIGSFARGLAAARGAFIQAASSSPRPHVLLTFRCADGAGKAGVVREARAAYGLMPATARNRIAAPTAEVVRLIERAAHAANLERSGRHASAERLLREVGGSLARRQAFTAAANVHVALGRMLLERGRPGAAEKLFEDAAQLAQSADDEPGAGEARIWQATARTDAGRLTDAESICHAVLLTRQLSPDRQLWATAMLGRVLLWQGRIDEARAGILPPLDDHNGIDTVTVATIEATAVRVLVAAGDIFAAGQRARLLMTRNGADADVATKVVALTAHLRVMAAAGDLDLAWQGLEAIEALSRQARLPLRAIRARLIWHDGLSRAGRDREARGERARLLRVRRAVPGLLRRAIDQRLAVRAVGERPVAIEPSSPARIASTAATLVHLVYDEETDRRALERVAGRLARDLVTTRIDLVSADAGAVIRSSPKARACRHALGHVRSNPAC